MTTPQELSLPPAMPQLPNPKLAGLLGDMATRFEGKLSETVTDVNLEIAPDKLRQVADTLRNGSQLAFDFLRNITGLDYGEAGRELKYVFYSFRHGHTVQVTVPLPPYALPHTVVPSLTALYPAADWHEREAAEMFGIEFEGHPNPKNLLLEEDLHIHPLLKAHPLQAPEIKQGIEEGPPGFKF